MKKRSYVLLTWAILTVLVALIAACAGGKADPAGGGEASLDGKALVEERCTKCHSLDRVMRAKKGADGWHATVTRMVGRGAQLNDAEQEVVINYLTETYPE